MRLRLSELSATLGLPAPTPDPEVRGYSIDSRSLSPGDLFFAIRGPNFDGHHFIGAAFRTGAVAAVASREWADSHPGWGAVLPVEAPGRALGLLALKLRRRWGRPVIAVTGSNGKTTTKDTIGTLLASRFRVSTSAGNLNNELGLPLSLLRIDDEAEIAVVEIGMNHADEIRRLAAMAEPTVGVVTNVSAAHIEYFSSLDEIAMAKRELIESLREDGTAVLNADDDRVGRFTAVHPGPCRTFGLGEKAEFRATEVKMLGARGATFALCSPDGPVAPAFESPLIGRHNVVNVLAALATASVFGIEPAALVASVRKLSAANMRGEVREVGGVVVLNDCYNANPTAMKAMLDVLAETEARRRVAVLGEMRELGEFADELHREVGRLAAAGGVDFLVGVTGDAEQITQAAIAEGLPAASTAFFPEPGEAGSFLADLLRDGDAVLFKASRGVRLERAVEIVESRLMRMNSKARTSK